MSDYLDQLIANKDYSTKTILVVEDDYTSYFFLEELLEVLKCKVLHAPDGMEAVRICAHQRVDLVLMDIQMPHMNGYDATRKIREYNAHVPIIAQTANALHSDRVKCIEAGCNDYIAKPIMAHELIELVTKYI